MSQHLFAAAFGLPVAAEGTYRRVLPHSGRSLEEIAGVLFLGPQELAAELRPLIALDVVRVERGVVSVAAPGEAVARYVAAQAAHLADASAQLRRVAAALPTLGEAGGDAASRDATAVDGDVGVGGNIPEVLVGWINRSAGDLCFLRPDQWRLPSESDMSRAVGNALRQGRRVRAIYPARALQEAPGVLTGRAAVGEHIRVLPEVPTRLAIVGGRALVPEPLGVGNERRIALRQPALVRLVTAWFDQLWDGASAVPTLDRGEARPDLRRLLLAQLADGVKDEQIARSLGLSLRTVRRRIAALMRELGVDTRFQAGVEAGRRGWL